ncbi:hypothetical protein M0R45_013640 [Rubus argutus]|uniref:MHC class II antigen n=1 Tax=Rubus argutus TaxID=59490 RepID=A0AAW1XKD9_RUBAR
MTRGGQELVVRLGLSVGYEGELVGFEELFCELWRGDNDVWDGSEAEGEYWIETEGEGLEGAVDDGAKEVEVADDGQGKGAWREVVIAMIMD